MLAHLGWYWVNDHSRCGRGFLFRFAGRAVARIGALALSLARSSSGAACDMALPGNQLLLGKRAVIVNHAPFSVSPNFTVRTHVEALGVIRIRLHDLVTVAVDLLREVL